MIDALIAVLIVSGLIIMVILEVRRHLKTGNGHRMARLMREVNDFHVVLEEEKEHNGL